MMYMLHPSVVEKLHLLYHSPTALHPPSSDPHSLSSLARGGLLRQTLSRRYHFSTDVYEAPGANQNGYQQHNYFFQPMYTLPTSKLYVYWVWVFIIGVNMTFLPMHFLGFNTMPRRYNESADACQGWNIMCTQGSFLALLGTWYCRKTG
ncbi:unnamed protein product [Amoebophrya sp. A25]|nr:unnamed protein product [Amoebophrya sp. A25]|eukprot:GSA25T00007082001.1